MSASRRQSRSSQGTDNDDALPRVAAVFVAIFDQREGYKLLASKSLPGVELEGVVDFKSFPSGLHKVKKDLIYFIHGEYAGISAFVNAPGDASQRNAQMMAVGALVPLSHGRLGRSWRHATGLEAMAEEHVSSSDRLQMVDEYWEKHKMREGDTTGEADTESPLLKGQSTSKGRINGYSRTRALSDPTTLTTPTHTLSSHHPAMSLPKLIDHFGPLIFPLYRAALLRKRVLMVGEAPVQQNCNFVYDLSILSAVPASLLSLLPVDSIPPLRPRALFNVGIPDIAILQPAAEGQGSSDFPPSWIACTTDDILASKPNLYDSLVNLSPSSPSPPPWPMPLVSTDADPTPRYPKIYASTPELSHTMPRSGVKATQRDLRRYLTLRSSLSSLPSTRPLVSPSSTGPMDRGRSAPSAENGDIEVADDASATSTSTSSSTLSRADEVVEAAPWGRIAYNSFIWWASAGEKKSGLPPDADDEDEDGQTQQDRALLVGHAEATGESGDGLHRLSKEMAIVGFFHRLTALLFTGVSDAISRVDGEAVRRDGASDVALDDVALDGDGARGAGLGLALAGDEARGGAGLGLALGDEEAREGAGPGLVGLGDEENGEQEASDQDDESARLLMREADSAISEPGLELESADVEITSADMTAMGLDVWSGGDRAFVEELVMVWWGRRAVVRGGVVQCCGVRLL